MANEGLKFAALALGIGLVIVLIILLAGGHKDKYSDNSADADRAAIQEEARALWAKRHGAPVPAHLAGLHRSIKLAEEAEEIAASQPAGRTPGSAAKLKGKGDGCCSFSNNQAGCNAQCPKPAAGCTGCPGIGKPGYGCVCNGLGQCNDSTTKCVCTAGYNLDVATNCSSCIESTADTKYVVSQTCGAFDDPTTYPGGDPTKPGKLECSTKRVSDGAIIVTKCEKYSVDCGKNCATCDTAGGYCLTCDKGYERSSDNKSCTEKACAHGGTRATKGPNKGVCSCPWGFANFDHDGGAGTCNCVVDPGWAFNFPMTGGSTKDKESGYMRPNKAHDEVQYNMHGCDVLLVCPWGEGTSIIDYANHHGKGCTNSKSGECLICGRSNWSDFGPSHSFKMSSQTGKEGPHLIDLDYCSSGTDWPPVGTDDGPIAFSNNTIQASLHPNESGQVYIGPSVKGRYWTADTRGLSGLYCPAP